MTTTPVPGRLYAVNSWRGEGQPAFCTDSLGLRWTVLDGVVTRGLEAGEATSIRPLVMLDLPDTIVPARLCAALRADEYGWLAEQIEGQTPPARIPEPGWGVRVTAGIAGYPGPRFLWVGICAGKADNPSALTWVSEGGHRADWDGLTDPELAP